MMSTQDTPQTNPDMSAPVALFHMIISYMISQSLYVAARFGIVDLLQDGPQSSDVLAMAVGAHPDVLYRVLRAFASVGIFAEVDHRRFTLTPLASFLQTHVPGSLRALAIHFGEEGHWRSWGELLYSVKTGQSAFEHVFGM